MDINVPPHRMFASGISYQFDGYVIVVQPSYRVTYRLDSVGTRGAVVKVVGEHSIPGRPVEAGWVVVTSAVDSQSPLYRARRLARTEAGVGE